MATLHPWLLPADDMNQWWHNHTRCVECPCKPQLSFFILAGPTFVGRVGKYTMKISKNKQEIFWSKYFAATFQSWFLNQNKLQWIYPLMKVSKNLQIQSKIQTYQNTSLPMKVSETNHHTMQLLIRIQATTHLLDTLQGPLDRRFMHSQDILCKLNTHKTCRTSHPT